MKYAKLLERFLKYVKVDTQSDPNSKTFPSTEKQKNLGKILVEELKEIGLKDAYMDEYGYVYATLEANVENPYTIGLIAHMDTSPDVSGTDVKPIVHENYDGSDIKLPAGITIKVEDNPELKEKKGETIITSDGSTLLGADDKAGIAEIMTAVEYLVQHPEILRPRLRIAFTPDEEIGQGVAKFDVEKFGADFAYTLDGGGLGEIEDETFCADSGTVKIKGINVHPGYAKGKMVNAIKIAAEIISRLPKDRLSPETTEGREGYLHPNDIKGNVEYVEIFFLFRDFELEKLKEHEKLLQNIIDEVKKEYPKAEIKLEIKESYRNMKYKLMEKPEVVEIAIQAIKMAGIEPKRTIIRGGTDGAMLSYKGLLTPNLFAGGHNFHSKTEWVSLQDMEKAVDVIINLAKLWAEKRKI